MAKWNMKEKLLVWIPPNLKFKYNHGIYGYAKICSILPQWFMFHQV